MAFDPLPSRDSDSGKSNQLAWGVFSHAPGVEAAFRELRDAHFSRQQFGVLARVDVHEWAPTSTPDGLGLGSLWALGIAAGQLPALGPLIAGGILGSLLASVVAGAESSGLASGLMSLGLNGSEAQFVEQEISAGRMVVVVQAGRRAAEAVETLRNHGGRNSESTDESTSPD